MTLTAAAKGFDLRAASLTGIGAFAAVTLGFFDHARRTTGAGSSGTRSEVVSLIGNIALDRGSREGTPTSWLPARTAAPATHVTEKRSGDRPGADRRVVGNASGW